MKAAL
jgi:hypothetical protein